MRECSINLCAWRHTGTHISCLYKEQSLTCKLLDGLLLFPLWLKPAPALVILLAQLASRLIATLTFCCNLAWSWLFLYLSTCGCLLHVMDLMTTPLPPVLPAICIPGSWPCSVLDTTTSLSCISVFLPAAVPVWSSMMPSPNSLVIFSAACVSKSSTRGEHQWTELSAILYPFIFCFRGVWTRGAWETLSSLWPLTRHIIEPLLINTISAANTS